MRETRLLSNRSRREVIKAGAATAVGAAALIPLQETIMKASQSLSKVVHDYYHSYEAKDRALLESRVSEDFRFTSPRDDHIDRATYFKRCWPNNEKTKAIRIKKLFEQGDEVFVLYELQPIDGPAFRNTEFLRTKDGKVTEVEVYFGSEKGSVGQ